MKPLLTTLLILGFSAFCLSACQAPIGPPAKAQYYYVTPDSSATESGTATTFTFHCSDTNWRAYSYTWDFGDGSERALTTSPKVVREFGTAGVFTLTVTATDSLRKVGAHATALVKVVEPALRMDIGQHVYRDTIGQPLTFSVHLSRAVSDVSYLWDFGDGSVQQGGITMNHAYSHDGDYWLSVKALRHAETVSIDSAMVHVALLTVSPQQLLDCWTVTVINYEQYRNGIFATDSVTLPITHVNGHWVTRTGPNFEVGEKSDVADTSTTSTGYLIHSRIHLATIGWSLADWGREALAVRLDVFDSNDTRTITGTYTRGDTEDEIHRTIRHCVSDTLRLSKLGFNEIVYTSSPGASTHRADTNDAWRIVYGICGGTFPIETFAGVAGKPVAYELIFRRH